MNSTGVITSELGEKAGRQVKRSVVTCRAFVKNLNTANSGRAHLDGNVLEALRTGVSTTILRRVQRNHVIAVLRVQTTSAQTRVVKGSNTGIRRPTGSKGSIVKMVALNNGSVVIVVIPLDDGRGFFSIATMNMFIVLSSSLVSAAVGRVVSSESENGEELEEGEEGKHGRRAYRVSCCAG